MEQISNIKTFLAATEQSRQPQALSQTVHTAKQLSNEQMSAMGDVIDRWRLNKGWNPLDNESQMMAIQSWVNVLDSENIPASAYNELFVRALKLRASLFAQGKQPPDMGIELMLACWDSLRREIEERRVEQGRTLGANASSVCSLCNGSGWREIEQWGAKGVTRCNHE